MIQLITYALNAITVIALGLAVRFAVQSHRAAQRARRAADEARANTDAMLTDATIHHRRRQR